MLLRLINCRFIIIIIIIIIIRRRDEAVVANSVSRNNNWNQHNSKAMHRLDGVAVGDWVKQIGGTGGGVGIGEKTGWEFIAMELNKSNQVGLQQNL